MSMCQLAALYLTKICRMVIDILAHYSIIYNLILAAYDDSQ